MASSALTSSAGGHDVAIRRPPLSRRTCRRSPVPCGLAVDEPLPVLRRLTHGRRRLVLRTPTLVWDGRSCWVGCSAGSADDGTSLLRRVVVRPPSSLSSTSTSGLETVHRRIVADVPVRQDLALVGPRDEAHAPVIEVDVVERHPRADCEVLLVGRPVCLVLVPRCHAPVTRPASRSCVPTRRAPPVRRRAISTRSRVALRLNKVCSSWGTASSGTST